MASDPTRTTPAAEADPVREILARGRRAPYTRIPDWVMLSTVSAAAKLMYAVLAMHVNAARGDGIAWPGLEAIAAIMGYQSGRRGIRRYLDELQELGAVDVDVITTDRGRHNLYTVHETPPADYLGPADLGTFYAWRHADRDDTGTGSKHPPTDPPTTPAPPNRVRNARSSPPKRTGGVGNACSSWVGNARSPEQDEVEQQVVTREGTSPPPRTHDPHPPHCPKHPNGNPTDTPCAACAAHRHHAAELNRRATADAAAAAAADTARRRACNHCDGDGWALDIHRRPLSPYRRCTHPNRPHPTDEPLTTTDAGRAEYHALRTTTMAIPCPTCPADTGQPCTTTRAPAHPARIAALTTGALT